MPAKQVPSTRPSAGGRLPTVGWLILIGLVALAGLAFVVRSCAHTRGLAHQVDRGLKLVSRADAPADLRLALAEWESELRLTSDEHRHELAEYLLEQHDPAHLAVHQLLVRLTNADFGERRADWRNWLDACAVLSADKQPTVDTAQKVTLERRWVAPVGLTAWFSNILPLDGAVYVPSLGATFDERDDEADGVVRVDGATGSAEMFFTPPSGHRGPRDVVGLAASGGLLFVACRNGSVYCLTPQAEQEWVAHAGAPVTAIPLAVDVNRNDVPDVVVLTTDAQVVAFSGHDGRTVWVTSVGEANETLDAGLGGVLALSDVAAGATRYIVATTPDGVVAVLRARDGERLGRQPLRVGSISGPMAAPAPQETVPTVYFADRLADVWSLDIEADPIRAVPHGALAIRDGETTIAGLRSIAPDDDRPLRLLGCPTGDYGSPQGALVAMQADGIAWRTPVGGAVWGTPAVADLNGDQRPEIAVAAVAPSGADAGGLITILSDAGQYLHRITIAAPIECSPVVADVDGDTRLELLVADQSGWLHCFTTDGYGPVEWGLAGGDSHNTRNARHAYAFGQLPVGHQWAWRLE